MQPSSAPLFTHLLAKQWAHEAQTPKPTALGTMLRYSGSYGCSRQMGYSAFDAEATEPRKPSGTWAAGLGTLIHEAVQSAIAKEYPNAEFEAPSQLGRFISGSCDAFIPDSPQGTVLYELKTMGGYGFDTQVGFKRGFGKLALKDPEGPKGGAIAQAGMNALGIEKARGVVIDWVVLGSLALEVVSESMNRQVSISDFARFGAEFWIPRDIWFDIAMTEFQRLDEIGETIDLGYLPDRWARDDHGGDQKLDPFGKNWQCDYCAFRTLCVNDGEGQVRILDSHLTKRSKA